MSNNNNNIIRPTGLVFAFELGNPVDVRLMLKLGCSPDEEDELGAPAIIIAARKNSFECIEILAKYGADINVKYDNETVAEWAMYHGNNRMMRFVGIDLDTVPKRQSPVKYYFYRVNKKNILLKII